MVRVQKEAFETLSLVDQYADMLNWIKKLLFCFVLYSITIIRKLLIIASRESRKRKRRSRWGPEEDMMNEGQ